MSRILVTGAHGQLGSELRVLSKIADGDEFIFVDRDELDITREEDVKRMFATQRVDALINTAAYTAVDKAESEREMAHAINARAAGDLAKLCNSNDCRFIHISTDFVFDGSLSRPLTEDDTPNPLGVYGATKWEGEKQIIAQNPNALILRTSWLYSSFGNNFLKTIIRLCRERESLNIIYDQIGTPTYAHDLARIVLYLALRRHWKPGLYHYSNEGVASWYDFALAIRDLAGLKTIIHPIETHEYPTPAVRPKYSVLNKKKIKETFGLNIPYWRDSLQKCLKTLNVQP